MPPRKSYVVRRRTVARHHGFPVPAPCFSTVSLVASTGCVVQCDAPWWLAVVMRRFLRTAAKRIAQQTMPPTAILPAAALPGWGVLPAWRALRRANPAARLLGGTALLHNRAEVQQTQRAAQLQWMNSAGEEGPLPSDEAFARGNSEELEELPSTAVPRDIKVVATVEEAQRVAAYLQTLPEVYHAIDTEVHFAARNAPCAASKSCAPQVAAIDVVKETPVGHGTRICFSVYCGPEADFGDSTKRLWVDVETGGPEVLRAFKPYLENKKIRKARALGDQVWLAVHAGPDLRVRRCGTTTRSTSTSSATRALCRAALAGTRCTWRGCGTLRVRARGTRWRR